MEASTLVYNLPEGIRVEPISAGGVSAEWIIPKQAASDCVIYYLHGGGYCFGSCNSHRPMVARLAAAAGIRVLHISYRLAPEHPFPAAVEDCLTAYQWLLSEGVLPQSIVIGGESAGGMFTLTTLLQAREYGLAMPAAAFYLSPHTDFTFQNKSIKQYEKQELFFSYKDLQQIAKLYVGDQNPYNPLISPIYADLRGLPPLLIHVAEPEILLDDALILAARARQAEVEVELKVWKDMFHAFQLFSFLPESKKAMQEVVAFARQKLLLRLD